MLLLYSYDINDKQGVRAASDVEKSVPSGNLHVLFNVFVHCIYFIMNLFISLSFGCPIFSQVIFIYGLCFYFMAFTFNA